MKPIYPQENFIDLHFPAGGMDLSRPFYKQMPRDIGGKYARTTPYGKNVRGYEAINERNRGGSRAGLVKWAPTAPVSGWILQNLATIVNVGINPPGGGAVQASQSGRVVTLVAVSQGNVYVMNAGDTTWTEPTNSTGETPPLNLTGIVRSTCHNQIMYFADGVNRVKYTPATNILSLWTPTAGAFPEDASGNYPTLICTWRGRIVQSGIEDDPHNWFMTASDGPTDWNYGDPASPPTMAVAGNNAPQGLIGDVVTALLPYTDDMLFFGGDQQIWLMRGDPMAGGQLDCITRAVGMAYGDSWTMDPYGVVYFVSNEPAVYRMEPRAGGLPQRISQGIDPELADINTGEYALHCQWSRREQELKVFITKTDEPEETTHWAWEQRTGAWFPDEFANKNHNPLVSCTFDGNEASDRVLLIGCWDGFVRAFDHDALNDDGYDIESEVWIGPLVTKDLDELMLKELQAVLGTGSGQVTFAIHLGATAEAARSSTSVYSGTWTAGRNPAEFLRRSNHAIFVKITSTKRWALEQIRACVKGHGKVRRRG